MAERERRRSRVLEYFEQQQAEQEEAEAAGEENPESGGEDNPFQDFDSAFGLDGFGSAGSK